MILEGKAYVFGDNINTDYIISAKHKQRLTDIDKMAEYVMEDIRPGFFKEIRPGGFIVAGINFGCGSSRETAPWVIKKAGISAVLAKGFARIFFRNAINISLHLIECEGISGKVRPGDKLEIDTKSGTIQNLSKDETYTTKPLPDLLQQILDNGGLVNYLKEKN